jgi:hypothetical protein
MKTNNEKSSNQVRTNQPLADDSSAHGVEPQSNKAKTGIGGCLLYPLIFLIAQPFLLVYMLLTSYNSPLPMVTYRIFWPYLIYDLLLLGAVVILLLLFARKKAILPAMFVFFLVLFSILSGLLTNLFWRLPEARVTGRDPLLAHFVMLFQCLLLVPYFVLDGRVKRTFIHELDEHYIVDLMVKPIASTAERLYSWLVRRGKKVFLFTFAFVIFVALFDWAVDSIVLYVFLR